MSRTGNSMKTGSRFVVMGREEWEVTLTDMGVLFGVMKMFWS